MADMDAITKQAALYQDNNGNSFGISANDCTAAVFSDPQILSALAAIDVVNGGGTKECDANDSTYAIAAARPTGSNYTPATVYWCADSTGRKCGIDDLAALSSTGECGCP
jgi:hypothetical protein